MKTNKQYQELQNQNKTLQERLEALAGMKGIKEKLIAELEVKSGTSQASNNFPISNSNILQIKEYLNSWLDQGGKDIINLRLQMMWSKVRYFENLLEFTNDEFLESYGHRLSQAMLFYGACAVAELKNGGEDELSNKVILPVSAISSDANGNVTSGKTFCGTLFAGLGSKSDYDRNMFDNKIITKNGIENNSVVNKAVFFKWESIGITYLWMLLPFIDILIKIINMLQINLGAGMHKYLFQLEGGYSPEIVNEVRQLTSPYSNVVLLHKNLKEPGRKSIGTINENSSSPPNVFTQQDLAHFMNLMSYFTAEFTNLSEKQERNINAEVTVNASYFSISQQEFLREARLAVKFYNKTFNKNASVDFTYNIKKEALTNLKQEQETGYQTDNHQVKF